MTPRPYRAALAALTIVGFAGVASAADVKVSADIAKSTTWTADNRYNLTKQVYVLPGATLTIEAGTIIASDTGSLAVTRGAMIVVQGTAEKPVIMTSTKDRATWTSDDPKSSKWRLAANEWGNLTLMGKGYISEDEVTSNTASPNKNNVAPMEGLIASKPNDPNVLYGGGNDDDDSGSISYLSIRYGGKVVAVNKELNGLSLGGVGRATDIHHVEIMNNVDDGIEIWGGTVNLKNFAIWNVGDDSFDVDQGWRGKAQFGLIVQGYSLDAKQGSGMGDNCFETDGAEDSHYQPVTSASIYNCTIVGQPDKSAGDGGTTWRDNARVQYRNCIFMDLGEKVVRFDNIDGDGANGYGHKGTTSWADTWKTAYNKYSTVNAPAKPADFYGSQVDGMLAEIKGSVFYNNKHSAAYTEADARGVFASGNDNIKEPGKSPITSITRGSAVLVNSKHVVYPVTHIDPRPAGDALKAVATRAPADGFFTSANYRGAFAPGNNWLIGWSAASTYGLVDKSGWVDLGGASGGPEGAAVLSASGTMKSGTTVHMNLSNAGASSPAILVFGAGRLDAALFGGSLVPNFLLGATIPAVTNASGELSFGFPFPPTSAGIPVYWQCATVDLAKQTIHLSNAVYDVTK